MFNASATMAEKYSRMKPKTPPSQESRAVSDFNRMDGNASRRPQQPSGRRQSLGNDGGWVQQPQSATSRARRATGSGQSGRGMRRQSPYGASGNGGTPKRKTQSGAVAGRTSQMPQQSASGVPTQSRQRKSIGYDAAGGGAVNQTVDRTQAIPSTSQPSTRSNDTGGGNISVIGAAGGNAVRPSTYNDVINGKKKGKKGSKAGADGNGEQRTFRQKFFGALSWVLLIIALVCGVICGWILITQWMAEQQYTDLNNQLTIEAVQDGTQDTGEKTAATEDLEPQEQLSDESWQAVEQVNPNVVAYLKVTNTCISYPVPQSLPDQPDDYYLRRDLWGNYQLIGSVFLDKRATVDSQNMMVYGHHITGSKAMFSTINKDYKQEEFDTLGNAHWITHDLDYVFKPLCAMKVDQSYGDIQQFSFDDNEDFREWLGDIVDQASAKADNADDIVASATRTLTLVTCSSDKAGQRDRTLVVFAR